MGREGFDLFVDLELEVAGVVLVPEADCECLVGFVLDEEDHSDSVL